jgi:hypothetical protein
VASLAWVVQNSRGQPANERVPVFSVAKVKSQRLLQPKTAYFPGTALLERAKVGDFCNKQAERSEANSDSDRWLFTKIKLG